MPRSSKPYQRVQLDGGYQYNIYYHVDFQRRRLNSTQTNAILRFFIRSENVPEINAAVTSSIMVIVMSIQYITIMYTYSSNSTVHKPVNWRRRRNGKKKYIKKKREFDLFAVETPKFDQGHAEIQSGSPRLVYDAAKLIVLLYITSQVIIRQSLKELTSKIQALPESGSEYIR